MRGEKLAASCVPLHSFQCSGPSQRVSFLRFEGRRGAGSAADRPYVRRPVRIMDEQREQQIVIQYRIDGLGRQADVDKQYQVGGLLHDALDSAGIGFFSGGGIVQGENNIVLYTYDRRRAEELIVRTLREHGFLDDAVVAFRLEEDESYKSYEVVWPQGYDRKFSAF